MTAVAIQYRDEIIKRVSNGALLKQVAESLGVSPAAISNQLHADPEYHKAREVGAEVRLCEQYQAIVEAAGQEDVSRAREGFRAAAWFAEREFPQRWGNRTTITVDIGSGLQDALARTREQAIESTATRCDAVETQQIEEKP